MDWVLAHGAVVAIGLALFGVGCGVLAILVRVPDPIEVPLRRALGIVAAFGLVSAAFVYVGSSVGTPVSTPPSSPASPQSVGSPASNCGFAQELLRGNQEIQALDLPPGSGDVAGYQIAFSRQITVPEGWTVQMYGQTHLGPFSVGAGDIASVWSPSSCRPLGAGMSSPLPGNAGTLSTTKPTSCTVTPATGAAFTPAPNGGPVAFQIDATPPDTVVLVDVWIPYVTADHVQYELILAGRKLQFLGAGFAWKYVGCTGEQLQSQVAFHRQQEAEMGTVISITEEDFARLYPKNVVRLPGDSGS